jgi:hypothetical protein
MNDPTQREDEELDALLQRTRTNSLARLDQILDIRTGISSIITWSQAAETVPDSPSKLTV